ncbi:MAG: flagellin FliC, partial [Proteobacteria bacterium]|nr:flagellin FliC [Pseudomonadota bacterium]
MTVINTNISANIARDAIGRNDRAMATSMERLSTGLRINSAKDDAAGMAIAARMAGQISGLNMAKRNANDAISMVQTIEGASKEITSMLVRQRELAVQSASETYSDSDRDALELEFVALQAEITRIQANTQWNGSALMAGGHTVAIQLGASASQSMNVVFKDWALAGADALGAADISALSVDTATLAGTAISALDVAITAATAEQAAYGAYLSRLTHASDNLS